VVPWNSTVVWSEVLHPDSCRRLAALGQYSGNRVGLIAYDMIPVNSAHLRPSMEAGEFGQYLTAVKHAHRVAGISTSATSEFAGLSSMLRAQGLCGPVVREVELAEDVGEARPSPPAETDDSGPSRPVVLLTARLEPHKNARAPLHAAQRLWREGLDFEVRMLSGGGSGRSEVMETVSRLKGEGHPISTLGWLSDKEMWEQVTSASFVVFTSLHEGYGLPVAEALACGTPVITTNYGSQREIGARGGCLMVDPRSDSDLVGAMRTLISEPERRRELREEIQLRAPRSWDDYEQELWSFLVDGEEPTRGKQ
jgi:glycosyltransferase involved in cell wall biosynthesis